MSSATTDPGLDPVGLEIAWRRIEAVIDEAEATLIRASFSPLIREAFDFGVLLLDGNAGSVAHADASTVSQPRIGRPRMTVSSTPGSAIRSSDVAGSTRTMRPPRPRTTTAMLPSSIIATPPNMRFSAKPGSCATRARTRSARSSSNAIVAA